LGGDVPVVLAEFGLLGVLLPGVPAVSVSAGVPVVLVPILLGPPVRLFAVVLVRRLRALVPHHAAVLDLPVALPLRILIRRRVLVNLPRPRRGECHCREEQQHWREKFQERHGCEREAPGGRRGGGTRMRREEGRGRARMERGRNGRRAARRAAFEGVDGLCIFNVVGFWGEKVGRKTGNG